MDPEIRKQISETVAAEAVGFYRLVVTTATAFLGGTLLFWEKVDPHPSHTSLVPLLIGWVLLGGSIALIAFVRRGNIECGRLVLAEKFEKADAVAFSTRTWTTWAMLTLAMGILMVMFSGFLTMWNKAPKEETKKDTITGVPNAQAPAPAPAATPATKP